MDTIIKIKQLWQYLKIQDDEILIVQSYNQIIGTDEFFITEKKNEELSVHVTDSLQISLLKKPFILIQQLDSNGKHTIPVVEKIEYDKLIDY